MTGLVDQSWRIEWLVPKENSMVGEPYWESLFLGKGRVETKSEDEARSSFDRAKRIIEYEPVRLIKLTYRVVSSTTPVEAEELQTIVDRCIGHLDEEASVLSAYEADQFWGIIARHAEAKERESDEQIPAIDEHDTGKDPEN